MCWELLQKKKRFFFLPNSWRVDIQTRPEAQHYPQQQTERTRCWTGTASSWVWRGYSPKTKRRTFPPFRLPSEPSSTVRTHLESPSAARTRRTCLSLSIRSGWRSPRSHPHRPLIASLFCPYSSWCFFCLLVRVNSDTCQVTWWKEATSFVRFFGHLLYCKYLV